MVVQECQERKKGNDPLAVDAKGMWGRLKCSPLMFWLAECSGVSGDTLVRAQEMAVASARINDKDGDPHGKMMRESIRPVSARSQAFSACQFHGMRSSMRLIL